MLAKMKKKDIFENMKVNDCLKSFVGACCLHFVGL